jgi:hypothetical protein
VQIKGQKLGGVFLALYQEKHYLCPRIAKNNKGIYYKLIKKQGFMKKRLLFAFMAMCASVSSFALSQGEFVYTPQGRFQITGANLNANNAFQDLSGWTVVAAAADKTLADNLNITGNG